MTWETPARGQGLACYADMCFCSLPHRLWPFGVKGSDNLYDTLFHKPGRMIDGKFYPEPPRK